MYTGFLRESWCSVSIFAGYQSCHLFYVRNKYGSAGEKVGLMLIQDTEHVHDNSTRCTGFSHFSLEGTNWDDLEQILHEIGAMRQYWRELNQAAHRGSSQKGTTTTKA